MADSSTVVLFEGGLDMVTPVQNSAPGTLVDARNYEVAPIKGYKRIDGYERFDNSLGGGISNLYQTTINTSADLVPGLRVMRNGSVVAVIVEVISNTVVYVPLAARFVLSPGIPYEILTENNTTEPAEVASVSVDLRDISSDADEYIGRVRAASELLRQDVDGTDGDIAGVYYGRKEAYVVVDIPEWSTDGVSRIPVVGEFLRWNGRHYRAARVDEENFTIHLIDMGQTEQPPSTDLELITISQADSGVGNITVIEPDFTPTVITRPEGATYAVPWRLLSLEEQTYRKYTPMAPALAVYYTDASEEFGSTVVLSDGMYDVGATVMGFSVVEGSFANSDAAGVLYLSIVSDPAWEDWPGYWENAVDIKDEEDNDIAVVDNIEIPVWAGTGLLREPGAEPARTFYQWGTYNFFATRGREMVFAVNGRTRGGWIGRSPGGEHVWGTVHTQPDAEADIPKYVAFHASQRLLYGMHNGSVVLSAVGYPLNFSGLDGAMEIGNGDNITGVLEASNDSTFLFGPRSIRRLVGQGAEMQLLTVSSSSGAFDYTAAIAAGMPLYVNQNGLCTLDQTSAYGDFRNASISGAVDPWFTTRILQDAYSVSAGGTVCAFPVRAKNQYRLFLGDGNVLSMAITPNGVQPMISNYGPASGDLRIPVAYSSSVDDTGAEYLLVVWDAYAASQSLLPKDFPPPTNRIYRLDHGWGFDGETFEHHIETAYMFNSETQFLTIDGARLYGMGFGLANLRLRASGVEEDFVQEFDMTVQDISMPRNPVILYKQLTRVLGIVDHANWGRAIKLRIQNVADAGQPETEPTHILQSVRLFVQTEGVQE